VAAGEQEGRPVSEARAPHQSITIRQRKSIGIWMILRILTTRYPRGAILDFSLFIGQAFLYNAITFG
jgi:hypothetical protein